MLTKSTKYFETQIEKISDKLGELVLKETMAQIKNWEKRFPKFEFKIGLQNPPNFHYRIRGEDSYWIAINHCPPYNHYLIEIQMVAKEANAFSNAFRKLDGRISYHSFNCINKDV